MKVAVIGECMVELFQSEEVLYQQTFGGDTFNCAVYLKRSLPNCSIEYITALGDDKLSNDMLDFFHKENINTTYVTKNKNKSPGLYIITTKNGERSFSYWRENSPAKELFLTKDNKKMKNDLMNYDLIYFSAITLAIMHEKGRKNLFKFIKKARKNGVKVAFDPNYRAKLYKSVEEAKKIYMQAIKNCDIFLPSYDDEIELFGEHSSDYFIKRALKSGVSEMVMTSGSKDVAYNKKNKIKSKKITAIKNIVDTTSAGDSFNGAYLASRLKGLNIKKSIKEAVDVSSKVIMYKGAIIPK